MVLQIIENRAINIYRVDEERASLRRISNFHLLLGPSTLYEVILAKCFHTFYTLCNVIAGSVCFLFCLCSKIFSNFIALNE